MSYHVQRNGKAIGDYDERTLFALLHAGGLRLTDTYRCPNMRQAEPLSKLIGGKSDRATPYLRLLVAVTGLGFMAVVAWTATRPLLPPSLMDAGGQRGGPAEEVHRAYPVLHGTLITSSTAAPAPFPFERVERRAAHGRVAILALDDEGAPLNFGSGFVSQDGLHVVTALSVVKGAVAVEIWFENGRRVSATDAVVDAEQEVVTLGIPEATVGFDWAEGPPAEGKELFVAGNALLPTPVLTYAQPREPDIQSLFGKLDGSLAPSQAGAAVLNAMGDICAMVTRPETGLILRAADIRSLLKHHAPTAVKALAQFPPAHASTLVAVDSAVIEDGELVMQLRNTSGVALNRALLHIRFHDLPPQSDETASLERQLATTAVEVCTLEMEAPTSDRYFQAKQELRQVTAKLEALRQLVSKTIIPARQRLHRTDVVAVEATLPPGLPQRLTIATEAGSAWGATVSVLDALE